MKKQLALLLLTVIVTQISLATGIEPQPTRVWRVPMIRPAQPQVSAFTAFAPFFINVRAEQTGNTITVYWGTSYYVDYCQSGTIGVRVWSRVLVSPFPVPTYTWAWVWWSVSAEVPAWSQMGSTSFQVRDGEYTNGEYWTGDLTPWSGCNN
jgi:hypothetical protein